MPRPPVLNAIVSWLRAGYPEGVPETDYLPLLALLARRLTVEEVEAVANELADEERWPIDNAQIGALITKVTNELPRREDVARVRANLESAGPFL
jgi:hypothetical protein